MHIATVLLVGVKNAVLAKQLSQNKYAILQVENIDALIKIDTGFDLMIVGQKLVEGFGPGDVERLYFLNNSVPIAVLIENPAAIDQNLLKMLQRGTFECLYDYEIANGLIGKRVDKMFITAQFDKNLHVMQQNASEKEVLKKELEFRDRVVKNLQEINANIIASITSGLIILDTRGTIVLANDHVAQLVGPEYSAEIGTAHTCLPEEIRGIIDSFLNSDPANPVIEKCKIRDHFLAVALYWLYNYDKQRTGILVLLNDISELENMNIQLYRAEKLATVGTMLSGIAHELRNPLSIISARAQRGLKRDVFDEAWVRKNFDSIESQAQRCAAIVNGLLDFTRHTATKSGYHRIAEVLDETLTYVAYQNSFDNIAIEKMYEPDLIVYGDRSRFVQIFVNLITNAAQAMAGRGSLKLTTRVNSHSHTLIEVTDNGPGIDSSIAGKIFDPFFTTKEPGQGNGLGLAIVYKISQESGGRIWFTSQPGETTFSVLLPSIKE